jgi:hypothetical protein
MTDDKHDQIVRRRVRRIAEEHLVTPDEVERALDKHPVNAEPGSYLKRVLALELVELDELQGIFHEKAVTQSDPVCGALCVKIAERRATLLGLNPPQGHAVQIISQPATVRNKEKSTEAYMRAFAAIGKPVPRRELESPDDGTDDVGH